VARTPADQLPPLDLAIGAAAVDLGYGHADDYHAPRATGVSRGALTIRDGHRVSTNDGYLEPARGRPNLTIRGDVLVDRVALEDRRAVGVVTASGDVVEAAEVIVAAGTIHSPAILLRSGIGPDVGLPVGANLADHAATPGFELALTPEGRMNGPPQSLIGSVVRYSSGLADAGDNDMQMVWFNALGGTDEARAGGRLLSAVMRVFSRGEVRLGSADPRDHPEVELRLLSDERDLVRLRDATYRVAEIVRHPEVAAITDSVTAGADPLDDVLASDDAVDAWLAANVNDYVHAVGTCRMGTPGDPAAVVDPFCRVIGFDGLRVCDASVMPDLPRANTHLSTVAVAEHLVTLLRS
jgi:choline dehydrogenase-like flavoprotein